ncbi:CRP-like cAMP-binding protein [Parabacteroides sp. PF5-5]|nr:CRP-like cAMP-binding protein [Parabacteroides sp. PH5-39]MDH6317781.1 CRP-like cAMP-binding protein [Parabacteroides sp. PF5-13]MDH6320612.1 CRP-like cAMP-binding protein [Parabacteroides sp. PH5-13]MDH6324225.1 CRP-like cAMP-binding protein [Parabacteroides sp. PH5-8]MDH6328966.1 CRP-like cAMP-binding protein [Parabacteroides sp. PH5-41]MDH6336742.1 CRP-like cAMP-binding protein [Parabacteroides sp. PF5-5]MDH6347834.1 CRP-like cAMP-binding protein [Parabacteroides sp. PH5-46]MDH6362794.
MCREFILIFHCLLLFLFSELYLNMNTNKSSIVQQLSEKISTLNDNSVDKLASILVRVELKKNECFLKEGDVADSVYFVHSGLIRQFYYKNGKDFTEHLACEGNVFMNIESYLLQTPTYLFIEALEPTVLYGIPYKEIVALMDEYPDISVLYRKIIEQVLLKVQRKIDSFRFENANERYRRLLRERPEIVRRVPLIHIASYLLMTPETLSRVRSSIL